ncbi:MAG TPA: hypothetical protein GX507_06385 [Clostridia bacterium]|nr:hypothetical protein [Clostridia bacterium]
MSVVYIRPIGALFEKTNERYLSVITRKKESAYRLGKEREEVDICQCDLGGKRAGVCRFDVNTHKTNLGVSQLEDEEIVDVSFAAWKAGIFPGQPANSLKVVYPQLEVIKYNEFEHLSRVNEVRNALYEVSPIVEPDGLDTFLEIPLSLVEEVIGKILLDCTPFTVIAGVAENKFLAKAVVLKIYPEVCLRKTTGTKIVTIEKNETDVFLYTLPLELVWPIPDTVRMELVRSGLRTLGDILSVPEPEFLVRFNYWGVRLLKLARGEDLDPIKPVYPGQVKEAMVTFPDGCSDFEQLDFALKYLARQLESALKTSRCACSRLSLEVQRNTFRDKVDEIGEMQKINRADEVKSCLLAKDCCSSAAVGRLVEEKWFKPPIFAYVDLLWGLKTMAAKIVKVPPVCLVAKAHDLSAISAKQVSLLEALLNKKTITLLDDVISFLNRRYGRQVIRRGQDLSIDWAEKILTFWDPVR